MPTSTRIARWSAWRSEPGDLEAMKEPLDFIGINLYSRTICADMPGGKNIGFQQVPGPGPRTDYNWEVWPAAIYQMIMRVTKDYGRPPIYITENGCSDKTRPGADGRVHDEMRTAFYNGYIGQVGRALDEGADVRGYYAWSLLDNFEWASGLQPALRHHRLRCRERREAHDQGQRLLVPRPHREGRDRVRRNAELDTR